MNIKIPNNSPIIRTKFLGDGGNSSALGGVQLGNHAICGVRHNGAEYSGNVTSGECDHQLFSLGAVRSGLGDDVPEKRSC